MIDTKTGVEVILGIKVGVILGIKVGVILGIVIGALDVLKFGDKLFKMWIISFKGI